LHLFLRNFKSFLFICKFSLFTFFFVSSLPSFFVTSTIYVSFVFYCRMEEENFFPVILNILFKLDSAFLLPTITLTFPLDFPVEKFCSPYILILKLCYFSEKFSSLCSLESFIVWDAKLFCKFCFC
jgi:hypothetical protein